MSARFRLSVSLLLVAIGLPDPVAVADTFEERVGRRGSNVILRRCSNDRRKLCNDDSVCGAGTCDPVNRFDLTFNFSKFTCTDGPDKGRPCVINDDCKNGVCKDRKPWDPGSLVLFKDFLRGRVNDWIYDVSDGQMCLRNVSLVVENQAPGAIVQVQAGICVNDRDRHCLYHEDCQLDEPDGECDGTKATARGGWGTDARIKVWPDQIESPKTFVHEFWHLVGGLSDEYEGAVDDGEDQDGDCEDKCTPGEINAGDCRCIDECGENNSRQLCDGGARDGLPCRICDGGPFDGDPCSFADECHAVGKCEREDEEDPKGECVGKELKDTDLEGKECETDRDCADLSGKCTTGVCTGLPATDGTPCNSDGACVDEGAGKCDSDTMLCMVGKVGEPCPDGDADCDPSGTCDVDANCPGNPGVPNSGGVCRRVSCVDRDTTTGEPICAEPPDDRFGGCIMGTSGTPNLCWKDNHESNNEPLELTEQSQCNNGRSCWDEFVRRWPKTIKKPAMAPACGPGPAPNGPGDICEVTFFEPDIVRRAVAVIDRSGSMDTEEDGETRIRTAVDRTKDFVDMLGLNADFGLASFSADDPSEFDQPLGGSRKDDPKFNGLRKLTFEVDRTSAKSAIEKLVDDADGKTRIGAGLQQAKRMLCEGNASGDGEITLNTAVLLLTDGLNNQPEGKSGDDLDRAIDELKEGCATQEQNVGAQLIVVCIGTGDDVKESKQCARIAEKADGVFVESASADDVGAAFTEAAAAIEGHEPAFIRLGQTVPVKDSRSYRVLVEEGVESVRFVLNRVSGGGALFLTLTDPAGDVYLAIPTLLTDGQFIDVPDPKSGTWTAKATHLLNGPANRFNLHAFIDHNALDARAGLVDPRINYERDRGFTVVAGADLLAPVVGCDVTVAVDKSARVAVGDGFTVVKTPVGSFPLRDDGTRGDLFADDGSYALHFQHLSLGSGTYNFTVTMECDVADGAAYARGESLDDDDDGSGGGPSPPPPPRFRRVFRFSGSASSVPDNLPPVARICRDYTAECTGELTGVDLDARCSWDPDGDAIVGWDWEVPGTGLDLDGSPVPHGDFPLGHHRVELEVDDGFDHRGLRAERDDGLVAVIDTTAPDVVAPDPRTFECTGTGGNVRSDPAIKQWLGEATAEDLCDGPLGDIDDDSPRIFPAGCPPGAETVVRFTAVDASGNVGFDTSSAFVEDSLPPEPEAVLTPTVPRPPRPPSSPHSVCSPPTRRQFEIGFAASDVCDPRPQTSAVIRAINHAVSPEGACEPQVDDVPVELGEVVELRHAAAVCPARSPRSARPSLSVNSAGIKVITGEQVHLRVTSVDECGNRKTAIFDPATEPSPLCDDQLTSGECCPALGHPPDEKCGVPVCAAPPPQPLWSEPGEAPGSRARRRSGSGSGDRRRR